MKKSLLLLLGLWLLLSIAVAEELTWQVVSTRGGIGTEKCPSLEYIPPGFFVGDYAYFMGLPTGIMQITLCGEGGSSEVLLETNPFVYFSEQPLQVELYLPTISGAQTFLGVDNRFWQQVGGPTWWKSGKESCSEELFGQGAMDAAVANFKVYEYSRAQWGDGQPHQLSLRVVRGDGQCPAVIIVKPLTISASSETTTSTLPTGKQPDKNSCKDFGVKPADFDLAYDKGMLEAELLGFLSEYSSRNNIKSTTGKYGNLLFEVDHNIFLHLGYTDDPKFMTKKEKVLGEYLKARAAWQGPLTPSQVLEESLKLNDNYLFEALLTAHNFLRTDAYKHRDEAKYRGQLRKAEENLKEAKTSQQKQQVQTQIAGIKKKLEQKANIFGNLQEIRTNDNVGSWYHLFGTLTASYSYPSVTKLALYWEHHKEKAVIDPPENCWDDWSSDIGAKLSEHMILRELEEFGSTVFEPSLIKRGYTL